MKRILSFVIALCMALWGAGTLAEMEVAAPLHEPLIATVIAADFSEMLSDDAEAYDATKLICVIVQMDINLVFWLDLPEAYEQPFDLYGKAVSIVLDEDSFSEDSPITKPASLEIIGDTAYGALIDFGEDFLELELWFSSAGLETETLRLTLAEDTEIGAPLEIGRSYEAIYDNDLVIIQIASSNG